MLVTVHLFLEMLHYAVWLVALPLIARVGQSVVQPDSRRVWQLASIPVARHSRGFPKLIGSLLVLGLAVVVLMWIGFSVDYATTRDVYFTVAIAHVLAEAPFLLKMI